MAIYGASLYHCPACAGVIVHVAGGGNNAEDGDDSEVESINSTHSNPFAAAVAKIKRTPAFNKALRKARSYNGAVRRTRAPLTKLLAEARAAYRTSIAPHVAAIRTARKAGEASIKNSDAYKAHTAAIRAYAAAKTRFCNRFGLNNYQRWGLFRGGSRSSAIVYRLRTAFRTRL